MALPNGITPKTATTGPWTLPDGTFAEGRATVTFSAPDVVHVPSGQPIATGTMTYKLVDGAVAIPLCPTDAAGLNRIDWSYRLKLEIRGALAQPSARNFLLPTAGPDVVDVDKLVTVPSSAGTPLVSTAAVVTDNGDGTFTLTP